MIFIINQNMRLWIFLIISLFICRPLSAESKIILSHAKVKELALAQGLEAELAQNQKQSALYGVMQTRSLYDTLLKAKLHYVQDKLEQSTAVFGTDNKTFIYNTELSQNTALGTNVGVGFLNTKTQTNSLFTTTPSAYDSQIYASIRQPLAKNFMGYLNRKEIEKAIKQAQALEAGAQSRLQGYVFQALGYYWQLYLFEQNLSFEKEAFEMADKLYQANHKKKDLGIIEAADLSAFAANRDTRKSLLLGAQSDLIKARENILNALNLFDQNSIPVTSQETFRNIKLTSLEFMLKQAFDNRPDYQARKRELEMTDISLKMAKNKLWPELDVLASLNLNGVDSKSSSALENIGDGHPKWQVGMEFAFPLQNRSSRSQVKLSEFDKKNKILEFKKTENEIIKQIKTSYQNYKIAFQKIGVLQSAITNQRARYSEEIARFEQGRSDSNAVIKAEEDLIGARQMLLKAKVDFRFALVDLEFAQGKILE
ncbi:MAG: Outer membrane protein [uncultured bacterium]|nr:MAG: Outer membrane protein [uncultured bacterium]